MLSEKLRESVLVDELQLGNRLNESVSSGDRADFQLLLSMLSSDVCDAPQFNRRILKNDPENLREKFALGDVQRFYADKQDFSKGVAQSRLLHDEGMCAVFLNDCLNRGSLCEYERKLSPEVYADLSVLECQKFSCLNNDEEDGSSQSSHQDEQQDGFEILKEAELLHPSSVRAD